MCNGGLVLQSQPTTSRADDADVFLTIPEARGLRVADLIPPIPGSKTGFQWSVLLHPAEEGILSQHSEYFLRH